MTLILSCVTRDYVLQVSDRCLTDLKSGRPLEQEINKAVVLSNRVAFAYTGLAQIERKPTDIWLRDVLIPHRSIGHAVRLVVDEATRAFARMPGSLAAKRQAFVTVGWARFPDHGDDLRPFGLTISNAIAPEGHWLPAALPEFSGRGKILKGPRWGYAWTHAGGLPQTRAVILNRTIARYVAHGVSAASMAELLVAQLRARAAEPGSRVGRGAMVNSIPRAVLETADLVAISGVPTTTELCFAHLRHDDTVGAVEGPHFVRPYGPVFSNFQAWREETAEIVQMDFRAA